MMVPGWANFELCTSPNRIGLTDLNHLHFCHLQWWLIMDIQTSSAPSINTEGIGLITRRVLGQRLTGDSQSKGILLRSYSPLHHWGLLV